MFSFPFLSVLTINRPINSSSLCLVGVPMFHISKVSVRYYRNGFQAKFPSVPCPILICPVLSSISHLLTAATIALHPFLQSVSYAIPVHRHTRTLIPIPLSPHHAFNHGEEDPTEAEGGERRRDNSDHSILSLLPLQCVRRFSFRRIAKRIVDSLSYHPV